MRTLQAVYASTSGHTEYVVGLLSDALKGRVDVAVTRVERATPDILLAGDALMLASGTWNTGGVEGQLNPYMHFFLNGAANGVDLKGKKVIVIGLGDERYRYTARAGYLLDTWVRSHGGALLRDPYVLVNEPYGQEAVVKEWASDISSLLA